MTESRLGTEETQPAFRCAPELAGQVTTVPD